MCIAYSNCFCFKSMHFGSFWFFLLLFFKSLCSLVAQKFHSFDMWWRLSQLFLRYNKFISFFLLLCSTLKSKSNGDMFLASTELASNLFIIMKKKSNFYWTKYRYYPSFVILSMALAVSHEDDQCILLLWPCYLMVLRFMIYSQFTQIYGVHNMSQIKNYMETHS